MFSAIVLKGLSLESHYDLLLASLLHVKARWFELGMKLNLSENFLDETETNMDSVEECLGEMLQNWLLYHHPTMETLNNALSQMNLSPVTFNTTSSGMYLIQSPHTHIYVPGAVCIVKLLLILNVYVFPCLLFFPPHRVCFFP